MLSKWSPWGRYRWWARGRPGPRLWFRRGNYACASRQAVLGALGVALTSILFIIANKLTTAANAIVLQYAAPIVVILICWIYFHQRPTKLDIVAACVAGAGVVLCFMGGLQGGSPVGDALALLSAVSFAVVFFAAQIPNWTRWTTYLGNLLSALMLLAIPFDKALRWTLRP